MERTLIRRCETDSLWPRITSIVSRWFYAEYWPRLYLYNWLLNNAILALYQLTAWDPFPDIKVWHHPPNWSQAQIMFPYAPRAKASEQMWTRSVIYSHVNTSSSASAFPAFLCTSQGSSVMTRSTFPSKQYPSPSHANQSVAESPCLICFLQPLLHRRPWWMQSFCFRWAPPGPLDPPYSRCPTPCVLV